MPTLSVPQVIRATGIPAFVKDAGAVDDSGRLDYRSKEATYISFVRTLVKGASSHDMQDCEDHVRFWGLERECAAAKAKYAELMQTPELSAEDYALNVSFDGKAVRKYAAYDGPTTVQAAVGFYDNRHNYPYAWRATAAVNLLNKAASHNAVLPEYVFRYLEKAAAFGAVGSTEIEDAILSREQVCPAEHRDVLEKVASIAEQLINDSSLRTDHDFVKEAMSAIDEFDALIDYNGDLIEEAIPSDMTFSELKKVASEQRFEVKLVNGLTVDVRDLRKEALAAIDPDLMYKTAEQLADILPTLPKPDADVLAHILA